ncbi:MAG: peptidyl-prolyl cis-trans isomerase [Myxococcales bacterium]|nr:peptidyl-prolyl cis-trans isomerase [Myxococcales bacterium]
MRSSLLLLAALSLCLAPLGGCTKKSSSTSSSAGSASSASTSGGGGADDKVSGSVVQLETSMGNITIELDAAKAPLSAQNFLRYVKSGHYDGTIFHRVIKTFMIQGGGFTPDFQKKPTRAPIRNEADNGLKNVRGTVAMARTSNPHSATAQFFINVVDNGFLDHRDKSMRGWGYTVFGKVTAGMDVVDKIKDVETGAKGPFGKNAPQTDVIIKKARIVR